MRTYHFDLRIEIPDIDNYFINTEDVAKVHKVDLVIGDKPESDIYLKIYHSSEDRLFDKVMRWYHGYQGHFFDYFFVDKISEISTLIDVRFKYYNFKKITSSVCDGDYTYFTIQLSGVGLTFTSEEMMDSYFALNTAAFELVEDNYTYNFHFPWSIINYHWTPKNRIAKPILFNQVCYVLEHNFYNINGHEESVVSIKKEPKLTVKSNSLEPSVILDHVDLICSLLSLYSGESIGYYYSCIYSDQKKIIEYHGTDNGFYKERNSWMKLVFETPINLLFNVDSKRLIENVALTKRLIDTYNLALKTSGESKFMLLYNVLEQIRNYYILCGKIEKDKAGSPANLKKVVETYSFKNGIDVDSFIKENLAKVLEIIEDSDQNCFKDEIQFKIKPIKLRSMSTQFQSMFNYLEIDPNDYRLNFRRVKVIRDLIFHGTPVPEISELEEINDKGRLPFLVLIVIFNYLGIKDIKKIEKIKFE